MKRDCPLTFKIIGVAFLFIYFLFSPVKFINKFFLLSLSYAQNDFIEEFNGNLSNPSSWNIFENLGTINFTSDFIDVSSSHKRQFPFAYSTQIYPINLDSITEIKFKFNNTPGYNYGSGISISDNIPPFPTNNHPTYEHSIIVIWPLVNNQFMISSSICPESNPNCPPGFNRIFTSSQSEFLVWHQIKIEYQNNKYKVFVNGNELYSSVKTDKKPKFIWFGNPIRTATNVIWTSFSIDFIKIKSILNPPIVFIPGFSASWNLNAIVNDVALGPWTKIPFLWPYENLKQTLISTPSGYIENKNYFEFYYDWRKRIDSLADDLNDFISNQVLASKSADTKVNLIGHSMGGLLIRAYASKYGDEKINKAITVGSPHKGALKAYYAWEGGQGDEKISSTWLAMFLYTFIRQKNFYAPHSVIKNKIPSIGDLLPIFPYLKSEDGNLINIDSMKEKNIYLLNLSDSTSFLNKLSVISGKEQNPNFDTSEYYLVRKPTFIDILSGSWVDGFPVAKELTTEGDLTVLNKSSALNNASNIIYVPGDHQEIIEKNEGLQAILNVLNLNNITPVTNYLAVSLDKSLVFFLHSPAELKITTPDGEIGHNASPPLAKGFYSPENKLILIPQALEGNYKLTFFGTGNGIYNLEIGQLDDIKVYWFNLKGYIKNGETKNFNLKYIPNEPLTFPLIDSQGIDFLLLAKEQLDDLESYLNNNISSFFAKQRLIYYVNKIQKKLENAKSFYKKNKFLSSANLTIEALNDTLWLRIWANQYIKELNLKEEETIYFKNQVVQTANLLGQCWISFLKLANQNIQQNKVLTYQQSIAKLKQQLDFYVEKSSQYGQNQALAQAYNLAVNYKNQGENYFQKKDYLSSYLNFYCSRLFLLETTKLLNN